MGTIPRQQPTTLPYSDLMFAWHFMCWHVSSLPPMMGACVLAVDVSDAAKVVGQKIKILKGTIVQGERSEGRPWSCLFSWPRWVLMYRFKIPREHDARWRYDTKMVKIPNWATKNWSRPKFNVGINNTFPEAFRTLFLKLSRHSTMSVPYSTQPPVAFCISSNMNILYVHTSLSRWLAVNALLVLARLLLRVHRLDVR